MLDWIDGDRAEKEQQRLEYEQSERVQKRQIAEHMAVAKAMQSEKDALQTNLSSMETEIKTCLRRQDELTAQNTNLSKELDKATSRLEESVHQFNIEVSDMKMATLKERSESEHQVKDLKEKVTELKSNAKTLTATIQELRQRISSIEKDHLEQIRMAREDEWGKISSLEVEKGNASTTELIQCIEAMAAYSHTHTAIGPAFWRNS
ncbi:hypothetical protein BC831DRAFT_303075 [Entophlyctis helioformis]|nr:hypothetical protein BC831DRAFT_303075 [Entophlyctis helioformis]